MSTEEAFVRSILDDPDDDTHRLVFADWLDDHGQPERAAFIRAQVRLATLAEDDPARPALLRDEAAYLPSTPENVFVEKLPSGVEELGYERGFPARLRMTARRFVQKAEQILDVIPLQHIELTSVRPAAAALAACPALGRLRSLTVCSERLGTEGAQALAGSPYLAGLRTLVLHKAQVTTAGGVALAASRHLAGLRYLDLSGNGLMERGNLALANSPHLANLEWLSLERSHVGPGSVAALANSPHLGRLRELNLGVSRIGASAKTLASSERLSSLTRLDVTDCDFGPRGARYLLAPTGLPSLRDLRIGGDWPGHLWEVEPPVRLHGRIALLARLNGGTEMLASSPLLAACHTLNVRDIDGRVCHALATAPPARELVSLSVEFCHLTDHDVRALAGAGHFTSLRSLSLAHNQLTEAGIAALLDTPFVRQLHRLDLTYTHLNRRAMLMLGQTDALTDLHELVLVEPEMNFGEPTIAPAVRRALEDRYGTRVRFK
jgi:uncharacterized protein (TIGR02996 family)